MKSGFQYENFGGVYVAIHLIITKYLGFIKSHFFNSLNTSKLCSVLIVCKMAVNKRNKRKKQLPKREYEKLKRTAYEYVVVQGMEQKEVAKLLGVTEATISSWANASKEGKWKDLRQDRMQCQSTETDNLRKLISVLSKQRLDLEPLINDAIHAGESKEEAVLRSHASSLSDQISKLNKALVTLDNSSYTLGVFIDVMDEIFNTLRVQDEELWEKTIEFQSTLIRKKSQELG